MIEIARLSTRDAAFEPAFAQLLRYTPESNAQVMQDVERIVADVAARGDAALVEYTNKFDRRAVKTAAELEVSAQQRSAAVDGLPDELTHALQEAAKRIRAYADRQQLKDFDFNDIHGNRLGQQITSMERVGIYVPGGKAAYPSTVLMNAIPAKVAGVAEIIMVVPAPAGELSPSVLAAAQFGGVSRIFTVGGAQAIAALAYGTATIPAVDKIVGPGNAWVAAAKRMVYGKVGIDAIAGPSEIAIICDGETDPNWIAMDLFAQAEHGEDSQCILLTPDEKFIEQVLAAMDRRIEKLPRAQTVRASLKNRGALILTRGLAEAVELSNRIAPEHLELSVEAPREWLPQVRHAGAVFLGRLTPEAFGDYCAGPNHVLPTARTARFSSPLGVYEFQKRTTLIECSHSGAGELAKIAACLAEAEGLQAHAKSARDRG